MRARRTTRGLFVAGVVSLAYLGGLAGCSSPQDEPELGQTQEPLVAVCQANVKGVGLVDTEDKYLPSVVHCENGGAPFEALKAQAIAARTYLYYKMETSGAIADGTGDQVYSCGSGPTAEQIKAVKDTAGQVLRYKGVTICAFFVAGGAGTPPGCKGDTSASTEKYVTYNEGKSGSGITQTTLGFVSPTNYRNRGCLSQLGSRCLDKAGKTAEDMVRFYYGADIVLETATGPCVPTKPAPDAGTDAPAVDTSVSDSGSTPDASADEGVETLDSAASNDTGSGPSDGAPSDDRSSDVEGGCACAVPGNGPSAPGLFALGLLALPGLLRRRQGTARKVR